MYLDLTLRRTVQVVAAEDAVHGTALLSAISSFAIVVIVQFHQHITIHHGLNIWYVTICILAQATAVGIANDRTTL